MLKRFACGMITIAACGSVERPIDGPAANCMTDEFDGTSLSGHWSAGRAGAPPTSYDVSQSRLFISDAPFATTPSSPESSWIYDLDTDQGNQLAWEQPIGGEDFTLMAQISWSSTLPEITLGGIGVADAKGTLGAIAGISDPSSRLLGGSHARLHVMSGSDSSLSKPGQEPGAAKFKIQRMNGIAHIVIDEEEVLSGPLPDLISNVVIYYVRHKVGMVTPDFGSVAFRHIQICRP